MGLLEHARYELNLIDCGEPEKSSLIAAVGGFASGHWSGGGVEWGIETLTRLLRYKPLTSITSEPSEWLNVSEHAASGSLWQSKRRPSSFSRDGGHTWYDIDDATLNNGDTWNRNDADWDEVSLGNNVLPGDTVRVKLDAYNGDYGTRHNGRTGELLEVRNGLCVVRYEDRTEYQHQPAKLEVLKTPA